MQLNFKTYGQGPPLIILHGLFGTLDNWQTLAKKWADDFTVYLVDQRNHGRSPHLDTHSYPEMARDLADFMESEWIHRSHVLGHSMGGKTAMQLAMDYPDLVDKLIVVDIGPRAYLSGHDAIFSALRDLNLAATNDRNEAELALSKTITAPGIVQFLLKNLSRSPAGGFRWKMNLPVLYRDYPKILGPVAGEAFPGPALFIRGANSPYVADEDWPTIQQYFPDSELVTIENAGHWVHAEQPAALYRTVNDFLR